MVLTKIFKDFLSLSISLSFNFTSTKSNKNDFGGDFFITSNYNVDRQLDTCSAFYFSKLSTNFGYNHYNSCGFVALASLLSYYDSFLNDDFIDDKYEINADLKGVKLPQYFLNDDYDFESPGIKYDKDQVLNLGYGSSSYVSNKIKSYSENGYFQFYLLNLAYQQNYEKLKPANELDFTMSNYDLRDLLYKYIQAKSNILLDSNNCPSTIVSDMDYIGKDGQTYDTYISKVIKLIKKGIPLLTLINNTKSGIKYYGHFAIAYDYQEGYENPEDGIIFNIGLSDENDKNITAIPFYDIKENTSATQLHSYFYLKKDYFNHKTTNNYYDSENNNITACPCQISTHPNHIHYFAYNYMNSLYHSYECECLTIGGKEKHEFIKKQIANNASLYCIKCAYLTQLEIGGLIK